MTSIVAVARLTRLMSVTAPIPARPLRPTYASRGAYCKRGRMKVALKNAGFWDAVGAGQRQRSSGVLQ